jgi:glycosyltransferase involved in cell wall biosynthesis
MVQKVLHIRADGSIENPIGGSIRMIRSYIQYTESRGIENHLLLVANNPDLLAAWQSHLGTPEGRTLGISNYSNRALGKASFWQPAIDYILENSIQILHSHSYKADVIAATLGRLTGRRTISTVHGYNPASDRLKSRLIWMFYRNIWYFFDRVVLVSEAMLDIPIFQRLSKSGKVEVIENFIQPLTIRRKPNRRSDQPFTIISIGRLAYEKNHILLCMALQRIAPERQFRCYIVGDGPQRGEIEQFIAKSGLDESIILEGFQQDVTPYYDIADVFILPSLFEGLPIVMLEAMSSGCPIIAAKIGQIRSLIGDANGLLFTRESEQDLAEKICYAMDHPQELNQMAVNARQLFEERFDGSRNGDKLLALYESL